MPIYMHADLRLKSGKLKEFTEFMKRFRPVVEERGPRMVAAYTTVMGRADHCTHIWEADDANEILDMYASVTADPPEFLVKEGAEFIGLIDEEIITLHLKQPYSP